MRIMLFSYVINKHQPILTQLTTQVSQIIECGKFMRQQRRLLSYTILKRSFRTCQHHSVAHHILNAAVFHHSIRETVSNNEPENENYSIETFGTEWP